MHKSVLKKETIQALKVKAGEWYLDATLGHGGHAKEILKIGGKVIACDFDSRAIETARNILSEYLNSDNLIIEQSNFTQIAKVLEKNSIKKLAGALFDCGTNSDQLKDKKRGFSFNSDTYLDMRMDDSLTVKAADLLAVGSKKELTHLFLEYGGERKANFIASEIVYLRKKRNKFIKTTKQLADLVVKIKGDRGRIHPATQVFQALRIAVNNELENLEIGLNKAFSFLEPQARLLAISFHDGEDKIINKVFADKVKKNEAKLITKAGLAPESNEIKKNYRSRSSLLKIIEKV